VVYWHQQPGGSVFRRINEGYEVLKFDGTPSQFKERASAAVGQPIEILFNDQPAGSPESVTVMRDERGVPSMVLARHGDALSFSVLNVGATFRSRATVNLRGTDKDKPGGLLSTDRVTITLSADKSTATVNMVTDKKPTTRIELTASELDAVLAVLGEARAVMRDKVTCKTPEVRGTRELMILDPMWRTNSQIHPSLNGIILRLRHPGFGWLTFLLPHHEARSLGNWLAQNSQAEPSSDQASRET